MTLEEISQMNARCAQDVQDLEKQVKESDAEIEKIEKECLEDVEKLNKTESISQTGTRVSTATYTLKDPSGKAIKPQKNYADNTTLEYNGVTYTYKGEYGAFVKTREPLCTKDNVTKYMIPKSILQTLHANVIVEFNKEGIHSDENMIKYFETSYKNNNFFNTSQTGELPISRIYNINHNINSVNFELNQYWTGNKEYFDSRDQCTAVNGCLVFSLINSLNTCEAQEAYDTQKICKFLEENVKKVLVPFKENNKDIEINNIDELDKITKEAGINTGDHISYGQELDKNKTYVVHTDIVKGGKIKTTGGHYILLVPAGDGNCYIIDSNNSLNRSAKKDYDPYYIPYMTYEDALKSLIKTKSRKDKSIAWEIY